MPKDFSFLQVPPFFEFLPIVISSSKEFSKWRFFKSSDRFDYLKGIWEDLENLKFNDGV
jgi:hypothetical protein